MQWIVILSRDIGLVAGQVPVRENSCKDVKTLGQNLSKLRYGCQPRPLYLETPARALEHTRGIANACEVRGSPQMETSSGQSPKIVWEGFLSAYNLSI